MTGGRRAANVAIAVALMFTAAHADEPVPLVDPPIEVASIEEPETHVVEVMATVHGMGRTPEEARHEALQRAREKAVAEVAGIRIAAQQLRLKTVEPNAVRDGFSYLVQTSTHGRIVKEEVDYLTHVKGDIPVYAAVLTAEVVMEQGVRDPGFTLDLQTRPATRIFRDAEPLKLEIVASRRSYITLLNVSADGDIVVLFPNRYARDNEVRAGETLTLGNGSRGFEIRARLRNGQDHDREQLIAVATLDPVTFDVDAVTDEELVPGIVQASAVTALNQWLLRIPVERRVEALWEYEITSR